MKRQGLVAAAVLAGGIAIAAWLVLGRDRPGQSEPAQPAPHVEVTRARPVEGSLSIVASGTVQADRAVAVAPLVSGRVVEVHPSLESGERIEGGALLFRVDPADYRLRVAQSEAEVSGAEVELLRAGEESRLAVLELQRFRTRADSLGLPPGEERDAGPLRLREPQLQAAQANLQSARARRDEARLALERTAVRMPFDGMVRQTDLDIGDSVTAGQPVVDVLGTDAVNVVVSLPDTDAALIPALWSDDPPPAEVRLGYGDAVFGWNGRIERVQATTDAATQTITAVVVVPRPFDSGHVVRKGAAAALAVPPLQPGRFVQVHIAGAEFEGDVSIPREALRDDSTVWVVQDGRLRVRQVEVLQNVDDRSLVRGQIEPGERVVTSRLRSAIDGMRVRLDEAGEGRASGAEAASATREPGDG